ncbi:YggS family pyridoxal phosphate-dependent enzyme [Diaphorobacter aerolatus]|uniref:Pyridoxal phosphate homeostasis protein n=1 Tax=Diaphorobacter aerolatus TaxID=1288495 RepID=A0A7H0GP79_9BURK|nr:YggS family pyridoxal phosphate-dependent enzyme [Diaphorobacter aerolatus]QNP50095.1 YggS family pyridoxal phosphate-dependent enzyme [Diaphorobacter aerolatus]
MTTISNNLHRVREQIANACERAGRPVADVGLLAVSKTFAAAAVREAAEAGQRRFGENYIQEAVEKMTEVAGFGLPERLEWHCIGPIQSNKTRLVAEHFDWAHTVDRLKIAQRLSEQRPESLPPLMVCIQVNIDGGANKSGVAPQEAAELARAAAALPRIVVRGLMCIPEPADGFDAQLAVHRRARQLFDEMAAQRIPGLDGFDTLSMGMTDDLAAAVAAGSTLVRVGSGIFGRRQTAAR